MDALPKHKEAGVDGCSLMLIAVGFLHPLAASQINDGNRNRLTLYLEDGMRSGTLSVGFGISLASVFSVMAHHILNGLLCRHFRLVVIELASSKLFLGQQF